ncbi:MAG: hypothetical protein ACYTFG_18865, partial [Planctomycetota bacterium]
MKYDGRNSHPPVSPNPPPPWSDKVNGLSAGLGQVLDRWFVQYNPLYFFSVFCVLAGVFVFSQGLDELGWEQGEFLLSAVVQAYEFMLIAGCALLFRVARLKRPAVILGLLEVFFLFDWTFRTEALAAFSGDLALGTILWLALATVKILALLWVFRIRVRLTLVLFPLAALVTLGVGPHILAHLLEGTTSFHLLLTWLASVQAIAFLLLRPKLESTVSLGAWGSLVLRRCDRA